MTQTPPFNPSGMSAWIDIKYDGPHVVVGGLPESTLANPGNSNPTPDQAPDGPFYSWKWQDDVLSIRNDRYGLIQLFIFADKTRIVVSPCLLEVLRRVGGTVGGFDETALDIFFRVGMFIGEDTPFERIRVLPPGVEATWSRGDLRVRRMETKSNLRLPSNQNSLDDEYIDRFRNAISRRLPVGNNWMVPISGGRDSRHILLELLRQGHRPPHCVCVNTPLAYKDGDVGAARVLCDQLGIELKEVRSNESSSRYQVRKNALTHFMSDEGVWMMPLIDYAIDRRITLTYDGIAGDVLSAGPVPHESTHRKYMSGDLTSVAAWFLAGFPPTGIEGTQWVLQQKTPKYVAMIDRVVTELKKHVDAPCPLKQFMFWTRTRREIAMFATLFLWGGQVAFPFLDRDLFDMYAAAPADVLLAHDWHDRVIHKAYPEVSHIPYAGYAPTPRNSFFSSLRKVADTCRTATRFSWKQAARFSSKWIVRWIGEALRGKPLASLDERWLDHLQLQSLFTPAGIESNARLIRRGNA